MVEARPIDFRADRALENADDDDDDDDKDDENEEKEDEESLDGCTRNDDGKWLIMAAVVLVVDEDSCGK
jgi:hypothetical protein